MPVPSNSLRLEPFRSSFAVWHGPRWMWAFAASLVPILYFLSTPPLIFMAASFHLFESPTFVGHVISAAAFPAKWCAEHCSLLYAVWYWEWDLLIDAFGYPGGKG